MINAVVRSTVMSVMMYISFPRQLSLDNDYHGIQLVLIHIFLLTHIKIHIILKNKFLIIKAKYAIVISILDSYFRTAIGITPDGPVVF
jgi:hypothetical protein